ncbi:MAG: hypothetical protein A3J58_03000 [Candidatus Sungbacteria bacterium RIFCSPHIGHO2_02_FULL_52_23]|uniref:Peptidase S11 D-alanyl-D-alanine carboxypeptidase A N-terminal domain-containing protein n=1 Tax=Candidatus Sungbacteria bacterium RIFCSPHIGHO2_02_FULL_52_23 TaxID=1802274 RepID=A0A1G2KWY7_9BACT|nr:MAG: hypothetical protein A3J58_03000 [Candidatus Sungbacteria bacterium RIFCSPHIGHO2_02_FULL_52_23]
MSLFFVLSSRKTEFVAVLALAFLILLSFMGRDDRVPSGTGAEQASAEIMPAPVVVPNIAEPILNAEAYMVRFADNASPLLTRHADEALSPASLTKIMTVFAARQILAPDDNVLFTEDAKMAETVRSDASSGEIFMRDDAVRMAMIPSANDAALALADAAGRKAGEGDFESRIAFFVRFMNEQARVMGLHETHFTNPTGLDAPGHMASVRDLAELVRVALARDPEMFAISREMAADVFSTAGKRHTMESTNDLLKEFPALAGGKTGMTDNAKGTLVLVYPVPPHRTAIIVLMKSEDRFGDGRKIIRWLEEAF